MDQNAGENANMRKVGGQEGNLSFDVGSGEIVQIYVSRRF
jgi:hypothetical protein